MKPNILVLYYTQSGQLREILDHLTDEIRHEATFTFAPIEPETPFPLTWKASAFFDAMPETVLQLPIPIKPLSPEVVQRNYDLVILGYQPWFLHPSQPVNAFLKSEHASILKGKPVVTVIGARNMWLNAQEKVKEDLMRIGASLVGNISLVDTNANLVSVLTVIRWSFKGQKEAGRFLPAAGVQEKDIKSSRRFGHTILSHLKKGTLSSLHQDLLAQDALQLNTGLVLLEKRGIKNFKIWSKYIREKGGPGDPARAGRVTQFKRLLIVAIFILSPISNLTAFIQRQLQKKSLLKDVAYFRQVAYEPGKI
jgi:menaquinone-dependent protoporphyrinogen IX oxidase